MITESVTSTLTYHFLFCILSLHAVFIVINIIFLSLGGDIQQEGLAGYRLGNAYEEIGDPETAILVRKSTD